MNDKETLIQALKTHKDLKGAFAAFKRKTGQSVSISWSKFSYLKPGDAVTIALEILDKHHGKLSNAIECICEVLTGSRTGKESVIYELQLDSVRVCTNCGCLMRKGYCVNDGEEYFCCDSCFESCHGKENKELMCSGDPADAAAYWTEWNL